jgi:hypothetical protein
VKAFSFKYDWSRATYKWLCTSAAEDTAKSESSKFQVQWFKAKS